MLGFTSPLVRALSKKRLAHTIRAWPIANTDASDKARN